MNAQFSPVKLLVPTGEGAPAASEGVRAKPLSLPEGLYQIDSVAFMTDGVSYRDVVRCQVAADNQLVAVELVERSPNVTLCFGLALQRISQPQHDARLVRLCARIRERYGRRVTFEVGFGVVTVWHPPDLTEQMFATALADSGAGAVRDDKTHMLGDWQWFAVSDPGWSQPELIAGADKLLNVEVEMFAVDWAGNDSVASQWDDTFKDTLREQASTNPYLRRSLDERRYVAAVSPTLRISLIRKYGFAAVGPQPFPIYPGEDERFEDAWSQAKENDGTVRWCAKGEANADFRAALTELGLDPDADPREPERS